MIVRRSPAIVLSLALGAAALSVAPALAKDGGATKDGPSRKDCDNASEVRLNAKPVENNNYRVQVVGAVFSDDTDLWDWKLRRNGEVVYDGRARGREDTDLAFRVSRTMIDFSGPDEVVFRAENSRTGEVCRYTTSY
jgi:hypothetical protein